MSEETPQGTPRLDRSTELAFERTRVAYERTMMAWIRTATSLITFGFTIYKLFQLEGLGRAQQGRFIGPREFAFVLVSIGLISLLLATLSTARISERSGRNTPANNGHWQSWSRRSFRFSGYLLCLR